MRIGFDARHLTSKKTGIGRYIENLVINLIENFEDLEIILFTYDKINLEKNKIKILSIPPPSKELKKIFSPFWLNFLLPSFLKKYKINIFHSPNFLCPLNYKGKIIITIHDLAPFFYSEFFGKIYPFYMKTLLPYSIKKANKIIVPTKMVEKEVKKLFPFAEKKTVCIYEGVDKKIKPLKSEQKNYPYLLYVGTIEKRKNILNLIKSFEILKEKYKIPHFLYLVGKKGHGHKEIFSYISKSKFKEFIIYEGYVIEENRLIKIYSNCDVFVYISLYEGFGLPVLEAMKCEVPVVVSKRENFIEITKGAAKYVDPLNIEEITTEILKLINNKEEKEKLIEKSREIVKDFSWEKTALQTYKIYKEILENEN
jgi:glycosyltransferase involved in cell wall biosynthesis